MPAAPSVAKLAPGNDVSSILASKAESISGLGWRDDGQQFMKRLGERSWSGGWLRSCPPYHTQRRRMCLAYIAGLKQLTQQRNRRARRTG